MFLIFQLKDTEWPIGLKNKMQLFIVCKKHTSLAKTHILKVEGWKVIYQENGSKKQVVVVIFIANQIDFKPKLEEIKKVTIY
jgi:hypothetical protein